jgi:hypothetical protein
VPAGMPAGQQALLKLEAPLTVQSRTDPGLFSFNKYSAIQLGIAASRTASFESARGLPYPDDVKKRLMIVPHCHVTRLVTAVNGEVGRVTEVQAQAYSGSYGPGGTQTSPVNITMPENGRVIIALGTIESTRLALLSFPGITNYAQIGLNFLAHLRSNLTIRIPRQSLETSPDIPAPVKNDLLAAKDLEASALFVKGRHNHKDGSTSYFHLQITASGLDRPSTDSEAELFKKIPDIDNFNLMRQATDTTVVITIRAIGEMQPDNPNSAVQLRGGPDEFTIERAFVTLTPSANDNLCWDAIDKASDQVAQVFAAGKPFDVLKPDPLTGSNIWVTANPGDDLQQIVPYTFAADGGRRDGLGTTHHEAGSLRMGDDPTRSVTDANAKFHSVENAYAVGPSLHPTVGSPNPMLTGVALARRLADQIATVPAVTPDPGFTLLFDGINLDKWTMSTIKNQPGHDNPGTFLLIDGALESLPGTDLGLFWHTDPTPPNFILRLEWLRWREDDNSGVFVRFPDPTSKDYNNTAFVGVDFGFEVQIDQLARNDGAAIHLTGAVYGFAGPVNPAALPVKPPGEWNQYEIQAIGQDYTVILNGVTVTQYHNPDPNRGTAVPSFIGLQTHTGRVAFRKIQIKGV